MSHTLGMKYQGLKIIMIIIIPIVIVPGSKNNNNNNKTFVYSAMMSLEDTEALVAPARSVGTDGF